MRIFAALAVVTATIISCPSSARTHAAKSIMVTHELRVGNGTLVFSVPEGESADFPVQPVSVAYDFPSGGLALRPEGVTLVRKYWDYRGGDLGINKDGTLGFHVRVREFRRGFRYDPSSPQEVSEYLLDELSIAYGERNSRFARQGLDAKIVIIPKRVDMVELGERRAYSYRLEGAYDFDALIVPITDQYYVQIQFDYIDNSHGRPSGWRARAQSDADSIQSSIRFRPR